MGLFLDGMGWFSRVCAAADFHAGVLRGLMRNSGLEGGMDNSNMNMNMNMREREGGRERDGVKRGT